METLRHLTIQGTAAASFVILCDLTFQGRMQARWRRWLWLMVPLAFLVVFQVKILPASTTEILGAAVGEASGLVQKEFRSGEWAKIESMLVPVGYGLFVAWAFGFAVSAFLVLLGTWRVSRQWTGRRFSTDSYLLSILEDCKEKTGVKAPIGLIVSPEVATPALLGWLRPRILLPSGLTDEAVLRHVLLHELAHFRNWDIPIGWLFTLARCVHWFNPVAYLVEWRWKAFREEAADETAIRALSDPGPYGETLLALAGTMRGVPYGALGLGESFLHLKTRIRKIMNHHRRSPRTFLAFFLFAVLSASLILRAEEADPKAAATEAMKSWLAAIDDGEYAASWKEASPTFQKAISSELWVQTLNGVRTPLGKCTSRSLLSAFQQTEVPTPKGPLKGDFVIAQFETSFENLKYAIETVTFEKDGSVWRASGYFIKPK